MSITKCSDGTYLVGVKFTDNELMSEIIKMTQTKEAKAAGMYYDDKIFYITNRKPISKPKN